MLTQTSKVNSFITHPHKSYLRQISRHQPESEIHPFFLIIHFIIIIIKHHFTGIEFRKVLPPTEKKSVSGTRIEKYLDKTGNGSVSNLDSNLTADQTSAQPNWKRGARVITSGNFPLRSTQRERFLIALATPRCRTLGQWASEIVATSPFLSS